MVLCIPCKLRSNMALVPHSGVLLPCKGIAHAVVNHRVISNFISYNTNTATVLDAKHITIIYRRLCMTCNF